MRALEHEWSELLWDMPGHGASTGAAAPDPLEGWARRLERVLDAADVPQAVIMGHSFGGLVAQHFSQTRPARCGALLAYAAVPLHCTAIAQPGLVLALLKGSWALSGWTRFASDFAKMASREEAVRTVLRQRLAAPAPKLRAAIYASMAYGGETDASPIETFPVGLIYGEYEGFVGALAPMRAWRNELPEGQGVELAGCGHMAHLEQPNLFEASVRELLRRLVPR